MNTCASASAGSIDLIRLIAACNCCCTCAMSAPYFTLTVTVETPADEVDV